ncbi:hypothetical protein BJY04DRAFT_210307 [Aspergillus karnatakaensis]|uniref:uncharacterized protein n=1 Tax=Aspergillus karnatakaensis TaxID=1810916 RepID=UPI003CCCCA30
MDPKPVLQLPPNTSQLSIIDMHTYGMPTRVLTSGYPPLHGTLLDQKSQAEQTHDTIRKQILHEPRSHADAFGAIFCPQTEHTETGEAHMGVLYIHGHGYSTMCGHATLAVARVLIDTWDLNIFPQRKEVRYDPERRSVDLVLHTPGGLVDVRVPTVEGGRRSDPSRLIRFMALPAYAVATGIEVDIPEGRRWDGLGGRRGVTVSLAYCGTFILQVQVGELMGVWSLRVGEEGGVDLSGLQHATAQLKGLINADSRYREYLRVPGGGGYGSVFGVMVTDKSQGTAAEGTKGAELGIYFFGGGHIDRSPTGSAAAARVALDVARGNLAVGESWTYHSLTTHMFGLEGMVATVLEVGGTGEDGGGLCGPVKVQVAGNAYYTGYSTIIKEDGDILGEKGFLLGDLTRK